MSNTCTVELRARTIVPTHDIIFGLKNSGGRFFKAVPSFWGLPMSGDKFYATIDKVLLAGILGFSALSSNSGGRVADELGKIRETLAVALTRIDDIDRRTSNLERLYMVPTR